MARPHAERRSRLSQVWGGGDHAGGPRSAAGTTSARARDPYPDDVVELIGGRRADVVLVARRSSGRAHRRSNTSVPRRRSGSRRCCQSRAGTTLPTRASSKRRRRSCSSGTRPKSTRRSGCTASSRDRVVVTGAHSYDHWFGWEPSTSRVEFAEKAGRQIRRGRCCSTSAPRVHRSGRRRSSSRSGSATFAASDDVRLREANVIVRPHPQNVSAWRERDLDTDGRVVVWPRGGAAPTDDERKSDYYDSIHHASAVVGINTSAQVEAAIVGRPVFTIADEQFRRTQEGTPHFAHIAGTSGDGMLVVAHSWEEHLRSARRRARPARRASRAVGRVRASLRAAPRARGTCGATPGRRGRAGRGRPRARARAGPTSDVSARGDDPGPIGLGQHARGHGGTRAATASPLVSLLAPPAAKDSGRAVRPTCGAGTAGAGPERASADRLMAAAGAPSGAPARVRCALSKPLALMHATTGPASTVARRAPSSSNGSPSVTRSAATLHLHPRRRSTRRCATGVARTRSAFNATLAIASWTTTTSSTMTTRSSRHSPPARPRPRSQMGGRSSTSPSRCRPVAHSGCSGSAGPARARCCASSPG